MFEIGQRIVCVETGSYTHLTVGKVYDVVGFWGRCGVTVIDDKGIECHMLSRRFKPHTESEAERRGAKFGVTGALKRCGTRIVFHSIREDAFKFESNEEIWAVMPENTCSVLAFNASEIRLDHEPEFIAWSEAPEELKYDASRVYYRGEPVKWIAKPEGALADVVYVIRDGNIQLLTGCLTVKL